MHRRWLSFAFGIWTAILWVATAGTASAQVFQGSVSFAAERDMPVYVWQNSGTKPRAVVLAIHGLAMHGTTYDTCARRLADEGYIVVAPDLHGFGRYRETAEGNGGNLGSDETDLSALSTSLHERYPSVPLFLAGESLGATLAIRLAATHPELVDGLILSAPALKHNKHLNVKTLWDAAISFVYPAHTVDVSNYIRDFYSEDNVISTEHLDDPLVTKHLGVRQLMATCRLMASTPKQIASIPADMPVLIMRGEDDLMIKEATMTILSAELRTNNRVVHVFPNRGHILLETAHVRDDTMSTVKGWLSDNCKMRASRKGRLAHYSAHQ